MIDLRAIRIGIEVSGRMNYYSAADGMRIKASGTKYANATQNECSVTISNLRRETRDFLLTETSPFNQNRTPKRLVVEVGRVSTGLFKVYTGDIISAEPSGPPDVDIVLKSKTGNAANGVVVSKSAQATSKLSAIAAAIATDISATLDFQALDKLIANYTYTGGALGQVNRLAEAGGVRAFVDDARLIVQDFDKAVSGRVKILNMNSGMVGIPKATEKGVEVTYLIDGESVLGGTLRLESKFNRSLNGDYKIDQLKFDVASHEDPFFYQATCSRL
ncbi:baseplate hub protein [Achromobacter piechaudii]|uniref:Uncharacterized protein n=1 Tax=Achromobacter piechaudii ATCC 43553 TaxID=742159 RepID=D4XAU4_9BURK|nr:hypothetical protein [Achromobacter piechaudii]EFF76106.1 hypothetical protein HMPREF0004_2591 [Achromobacter piechaudii ATCC 43553]